MKLTNNQALLYLDRLRKVTGCKGKLGWAVYRNIKVLSGALEEYNRMHDDLVRKYSENGRTVDKDKVAEFTAELEPLLGIEQELDIYTLPEADMYDESLTAQDYMRLDFMISEV